MAPTHPPLVGWSDIHLSNYHLSIRDQFTITTYYLVLRITCLTSNQQNFTRCRIGVPSTPPSVLARDKSRFDLRLLVLPIGHLPLQPTPLHLKNQEYRKARKNENLAHIWGIGEIPSNTTIGKSWLQVGMDFFIFMHFIQRHPFSATSSATLSPPPSPPPKSFQYSTYLSYSNTNRQSHNTNFFIRNFTIMSATLSHSMSITTSNIISKSIINCKSHISEVFSRHLHSLTVIIWIFGFLYVNIQRRKTQQGNLLFEESPSDWPLNNITSRASCDAKNA